MRIPIMRDDLTFGDAFSAARKVGAHEFVWKGSRYHTLRSDEVQQTRCVHPIVGWVELDGAAEGERHDSATENERVVTFTYDELRQVREAMRIGVEYGATFEPFVGNDTKKMRGALAVLVSKGG